MEVKGNTLSWGGTPVKLKYKYLSSEVEEGTWRERFQWRPERLKIEFCWTMYWVSVPDCLEDVVETMTSKI